jgi:alkylated DNA repair dioxygenase AlkB
LNLSFNFSDSSFNNHPNNHLPYQGIVKYYGVILQPEIADAYFQRLLYETPWQHDQAIMFGKHITTRRKVAWYGDAGFNYNYSHINHYALPWSALLLHIKHLVEEKLGVCYNSVLLNLYHNGSEGMGWHHDNEKGLGKNSPMASLSLGATRRFDLRHKSTKKTVSIDLEQGSLLAMYGETQTHWLHQIPKQLKVKDARINLTFRRLLE